MMSTVLFPWDLTILDSDFYQSRPLFESSSLDFPSRISMDKKSNQKAHSPAFVPTPFNHHLIS
jgi:hypothetical protein